MDNFYTVLQIVGWVVGALVVVGIAIAVIYFSAQRKLRSENREKTTDALLNDEKYLRPYKDATEGYRLQVELLERDVERLKSQLSEALKERDGLRNRVRELEELISNQTATLLRQQGEIDRLKRQVDDLGDLREQLANVLTEIKDSNRG